MLYFCHICNLKEEKILKLQIIKAISLSFVFLVLNGCVSTEPEKQEPLLEVYPTNMNDCKPVIDNEDYINIDCKRRSVNRLTDDVHYMDEPGLVTMQGFSMMESTTRICKDLNEEDIKAVNLMITIGFQDTIIRYYDLNNHPEFKKEFNLISEKLKGQYDDIINDKDCQNMKELAQKKYHLK